MTNLFDLKDKTAIVTGGGRGLGKQMAYTLASAGANVVICSRKLEECQKAQAQLEQMGYKALALQCDVTQQDEIQAVVDKTIQHFSSIDILINNSGTSWMASTLDHPADKWDKVMDVNVKGAFMFSQSVAKKMIEQGRGGKILNISSITGFRGIDPNLQDTIAYSTSKGALIILTKELAVKLGSHNIQVNALAPGLIPTKMTSVFEQAQSFILRKIPAKRLGKPDDLAGPVLFLCSNASDYVTGQILAIDGGLSSSL